MNPSWRRSVWPALSRRPSMRFGTGSSVSGWGKRASFFSGNPIYQRIRTGTGETAPDLADDNGHAWAADLQHDLEELSLLSHVFSRTKKRDVFRRCHDSDRTRSPGNAD